MKIRKMGLLPACVIVAVAVFTLSPGRHWLPISDQQAATLFGGVAHGQIVIPLGYCRLQSDKIYFWCVGNCVNNHLAFYSPETLDPTDAATEGWTCNEAVKGYCGYYPSTTTTCRH